MHPFGEYRRLFGALKMADLTAADIKTNNSDLSLSIVKSADDGLDLEKLGQPLVIACQSVPN